VASRRRLRRRLAAWRSSTEAACDGKLAYRDPDQAEAHASWLAGWVYRAAEAGQAPLGAYRCVRCSAAAGHAVWHVGHVSAVGRRLLAYAVGTGASA
jgi:hypothetical protein